MDTSHQRNDVDAVDRVDHRAVVRTIMFSDVIDSTSYAEANGDFSLVRLLDEHDRIIRRVAAEAGGQFVKGTGDGAMLAFVDPCDAVEAAVAVQRESLEVPIPLRVGLDHGPVIESRDGDYRGLIANIAARLSSVAGVGQVVATDRVIRAARLSGPTRPCALRGVRVRQRVRVYTVAAAGASPS